MLKIKTKPISWKDLNEGITIDIPEEVQPSSTFGGGLKNLWKSKVTIYNDIPKSAVEERHFDKFVIDKCNIQGGLVNEANGTITNIVNAKSVITRDTNRYKTPLEYAELPVDLRVDYFTAQIGDFIVFAEVDDVVTTASEFSQLQTKYRNNGMKITSVSANIFGLSVDNVTMTNT